MKVDVPVGTSGGTRRSGFAGGRCLTQATGGTTLSPGECRSSHVLLRGRSCPAPNRKLAFP